jgi:hypothetical protein
VGEGREGVEEIAHDGKNHLFNWQFSAVSWNNFQEKWRRKKLFAPGVILVLTVSGLKYYIAVDFLCGQGGGDFTQLICFQYRLKFLGKLFYPHFFKNPRTKTAYNND